MSEPKKNPRRSGGVLLHPTSLPGQYGIGDLGPAAYAWMDALVSAYQRKFQTAWALVYVGALLALRVLTFFLGDR